MPKAKKYEKLPSGEVREIKTSRKFRVANRKDGRTAHTMTSEALVKITMPKYKARAHRVLEGRS